MNHLEKIFAGCKSGIIMPPSVTDIKPMAGGKRRKHSSDHSSKKSSHKKSSKKHSMKRMKKIIM